MRREHGRVRSKLFLLLPTMLALGGLVIAEVVINHWDLNYRRNPRRQERNTDRMLRSDEFAVRVVTNALGYREPRLPSPKPPGTFRIVVVGDSFTNGFGVEEDEAFPRALETRLRGRYPDHGWEVVNLGVPSSNPRDYLGTLLQVGLQYLPDVVVVGTMANDVHDIYVQREYHVRYQVSVIQEARRDVSSPFGSWRPVAARILPSLQLFVTKRMGRLTGWLGPESAAAPEIEPFPEARWRDVLDAFAGRLGAADGLTVRLAALAPEDARAIRQVLTGTLHPNSIPGRAAYMRLLGLVVPAQRNDAVLLPPKYDDAWAWMARTLRTLDDVAHAHGARTIITFIPAVHQVTDAPRRFLEARGFHWDPRTRTDTTFRDRVAAWADETNVGYVDLLDALRTSADRTLYFPADGHWAPAGHALAADLLLEPVAAAARAAID